MMREEVIKALERCIHGDSCSECICFPIRWERFGKIIPCMENLMGEALALLKAEPKRGRWIEESDRERHWHCSGCGYTAGIAAKTYKYCPECGAKMEADDEHTKPDRDT